LQAGSEIRSLAEGQLLLPGASSHITDYYQAGEVVFRTLKHLLATEACQVQSEDAYYGHLVLRLMGSFILFYTSRVICKGHLTMEEMIFSLKHYWRFVDSEARESQGLSWDGERKIA
jgi:hypothetical protein